MQPLAVINTIDFEAISSSPSSSLTQDEENLFSAILDFEYNENKQINCVLDENNSNFTSRPPPQAALLSTSNVHLHGSSIQVM